MNCFRGVLFLLALVGASEWRPQCKPPSTAQTVARNLWKVAGGSRLWDWLPAVPSGSTPHSAECARAVSGGGARLGALDAVAVLLRAYGGSSLGATLGARVGPRLCVFDACSVMLTATEKRGPTQCGAAARLVMDAWMHVPWLISVGGSLLVALGVAFLVTVCAGE